MKTIPDKPISFISAVPVKQLIGLSLLAIFSSLTPFISFWGLLKVIDTISGAGSQTNIILYIILIGIFLVTNDTFEAICRIYSTHMEGKIFLEMKEKLFFKILNSSCIDILKTRNL